MQKSTETNRYDRIARAHAEQLQTMVHTLAESVRNDEIDLADAINVALRAGALSVAREAYNRPDVTGGD